MSTKQVSFHMPADQLREFDHHLKRMGATKSGVIRSLLHDWMAWRREVQAGALKAHEEAGRKVDWNSATVNGDPISLR